MWYSFFSMRGMHALCAVCSACINFFLSFFLNKPLSKIISGWSLDRFSPNFHLVISIWSCGRYLIIDYWSDPLFLITQGTLLWQLILGSEMTISAYSSSFVALTFQNGVDYRSSNFKRFICNDLATSCKNLVNFGPVTPEFKRLKGVHPLLISSLAMFAWRRYC